MRPPPMLATRPISHSTTSATITNQSNPDKLTFSLLLGAIPLKSCRCARPFGELEGHQHGRHHQQDVHERAGYFECEAYQPENGQDRDQGPGHRYLQLGRATVRAPAPAVTVLSWLRPVDLRN